MHTARARAIQMNDTETARAQGINIHGAVHALAGEDDAPPWECKKLDERVHHRIAPPRLTRATKRTTEAKGRAEKTDNTTVWQHTHGITTEKEEEEKHMK